MRTVTLRVAVMFASLVVSVLIAELALGVLRPVPNDQLLPLSYRGEQLRIFSSGQSYARFDQELGWVIRPDLVRRQGDVVYRTNRDGIRARRNHPYEPPPGVARLAAFGDSFTWCFGVDLSECWTSELEDAWPGVEVLNFGVPGYGPDQAWLRYQRQGPAYQPCGVLIGYLVENINRVVSRFRPYLDNAAGLVAAKPRFLLEGDSLVLLRNPVTSPEQVGDPLWTERTLGPHDHWYFPGLLVPNPLDFLHTVRLIRTAAYHNPFSDRWFTRGLSKNWDRLYAERGEAYQVAGRVLIEFARDVSRQGATPVVVVFPSQFELDDMVSGRPKAYAPLLEWLEREGVATIDLADALAVEARRTGARNIVPDHMSPYGNRLAARELARRLPPLLSGTCGA